MMKIQALLRLYTIKKGGQKKYMPSSYLSTFFTYFIWPEGHTVLSICG